jgi:plastocyanin
MPRHHRHHAALLLAAIAALAAGACGDDDSDESTAAAERPKPAPAPAKTVEIASVPPGKQRFSPRRLTLDAGTYRVVLDNREAAQHSVRIQTGSECCWKGEDVGGTDTTSKVGKVSGTAKLAPGRYVFLCTTHWRGGMTGRITVR